jgi:hypothetical protein
LSQFLNDTTVDVRPFLPFLAFEATLTRSTAPPFAAVIENVLASYQRNPTPTVAAALVGLKEINETSKLFPEVTSEVLALSNPVNLDVTSLDPAVRQFLGIVGSSFTAAPATLSGESFITNLAFMVSLADTLGALGPAVGGLDIGITNQLGAVEGGAFSQTFTFLAPASGQLLLQISPTEGELNATLSVRDELGQALFSPNGSANFEVASGRLYTIEVTGLSAASTGFNLSLALIFSGLSVSAQTPLPVLSAEESGRGAAAILTPLGTAQLSLIPLVLPGQESPAQSPAQAPGIGGGDALVEKADAGPGAERLLPWLLARREVPQPPPAGRKPETDAEDVLAFDRAWVEGFALGNALDSPPVPAVQPSSGQPEAVSGDGDSGEDEVAPMESEALDVWKLPALI